MKYSQILSKQPNTKASKPNLYFVLSNFDDDDDGSNNENDKDDDDDEDDGDVHDNDDDDDTSLRESSLVVF